MYFLLAWYFVGFVSGFIINKHENYYLTPSGMLKIIIYAMFGLFLMVYAIGRVYGLKIEKFTNKEIYRYNSRFK